MRRGDDMGKFLKRRRNVGKCEKREGLKSRGGSRGCKMREFGGELWVGGAIVMGGFDVGLGYFFPSRWTGAIGIGVGSLTCSGERFRERWYQEDETGVHPDG